MSLKQTTATTTNGEEKKVPVNRKLPQHGVKGAYYGGDWVDIEDCVGKFVPGEGMRTSGDDFRSKVSCADCKKSKSCRSGSKLDASLDGEGGLYDIVIIGAGCVGSAIARELSKYKLSVLMLEAADDVSQGATKGNSGIVHAGYDDKPGSVRAKFCWKGNQMFAKLDEELRFGYQRNGSLVLAMDDTKQLQVLHELKQRGEINGVENLQILTKEELFEMEPNVNPDATGALYSPDAGNVIPYEFAIALAENAVDNGVELRIRREVTQITKQENNDHQLFQITVRHWEPQSYPYQEMNKQKPSTNNALLITTSIISFILSTALYYIYVQSEHDIIIMNRSLTQEHILNASIMLIITAVGALCNYLYAYSTTNNSYNNKTLKELVEACDPPKGSGGGKVSVEDMFTGGSGSWNAVQGVTVNHETIQAKYVINCAGGASDRIAKLIGDNSFTIKPRLGDYLLLNRNQGYLTSKTLFPCPDPVLGKGVLVQTTLWGNLILGPTARDTYKPEARDMSDESVQNYILSKCKNLVPHFDAKETIHAFCGARAKNSRGDWIIERSAVDGNFIHAAGIDSPGLAGSPAIAIEIVKLLQDAAGVTQFPLNNKFNPHRAPIITPKRGMKGLKMGPIGKNDSLGTDSLEDEKKMESNIICKCEKTTEAEIVRAVRRSLPIDSSQAIRKRTRAGMGHCQGDMENYNCECRVKAIVARENRVSLEEVGGRPWPATSILPKRWIDDKDKDALKQQMMKE